MSTDRDVTRTVRAWLEMGVTSLPDRVLDSVMDQLPATRQRRAWWPARRLNEMSNAPKFAIAAAAVVVVAALGINFLPLPGGSGGPGSPPSLQPSPSESDAVAPTASAAALREGTLTPGTYAFVPCSAPPCPTSDESIRVTMEVPDGWSGVAPAAVWIDENAAPGGAALAIGLGGNPPRDPCLTTDLIDAGGTVDGFADAIASHPILDATDPVDVTLDGYAGKYIDLDLPADPGCAQFRPWEPGIYAQGPSHQWHLWVLDVEGTRVVVQAMDYPGTSPQRRAELQAMVDSIRIQP
jgi:hypothetical protein